MDHVEGKIEPVPDLPGGRLTPKARGIRVHLVARPQQNDGVPFASEAHAHVGHQQMVGWANILPTFLPFGHGSKSRLAPREHPNPH